MSEHKAPDVVDAAGITYRQLDYWTTRGWLRPRRHAHNPGAGNLRAYTDHEVRVAVLMGDLVRSGVTPPRAAKVARLAASKGSARLGMFTVLVGESA
jgi:hypothetical protein